VPLVVGLNLSAVVASQRRPNCGASPGTKAAVPVHRSVAEARMDRFATLMEDEPKKTANAQWSDIGWDRRPVEHGWRLSRRFRLWHSLGGWPAILALAAATIVLGGAAILGRDRSALGGLVFVAGFAAMTSGLTYVGSGRFELRLDACGVTDRRVLRTVRLTNDDLVALSWDRAWWAGPGLWRFGVDRAPWRGGDS
jgi:hypothetical protein